MRCRDSQLVRRLLGMETVSNESVDSTGRTSLFLNRLHHLVAIFSASAFSVCKVEEMTLLTSQDFYEDEGTGD